MSGAVPEGGGARVLFDATSIPPSQGGVSRYIFGVLSALDELGFRMAVVVREEHRAALERAAPGHRYITAPRAVSKRPVRLLWEQVGLPALATRTRARIVHSPHYTTPILGRFQRVVTVHDATFFSDPGSHSRLKGAFFRTWSRIAVRLADGLITPSTATADELRSHLARARRSTIRTAYLGVDRERFRPPAASEVDAARAVIPTSPESWIAFLGTIEPRKNVPALLEAHAILRARDATTPPLVLAGARGWDAVAIRMLDDSSAEAGIIEAGYLPTESLPAFLGGAQVVVYPSTGEGFGLPVVEAMATGAPVLTTRALALPEVGGDAVAYSAPDALSLADALGDLLGDAARRDELSAAGRARSAEFTWERCARAHLDAYTAAEARR